MRHSLLWVVVAFLTLSPYAWGGDGDPVDHPRRITSHPGQDYMPTLSPGGKFLLFVSDRGGAPNLWLKTFSTAEIPTPRRLTDNPAGEKNPSFSPDGRQVVYTTYDADAEGDLAIMTLPTVERLAAGIGPTVTRLTGGETADREPIFTRRGGEIVYVSSRKPGGEGGLWRLDLKSGETVRLTTDGATPTLAPDDRRIVYTRRPSPGVSELWLLDLDEGDPVRLTAGPLDSWPTFTGPNRVVFVRYLIDTDGDRRLTVDDRPALYQLDLTRPDLPPVPLTPHDRQALFPTGAGERGVVYTEAGDGVDLFLVGPHGMVPPGADRAASVAMAERIDRYYPDNIAYRSLGWRVAATAHDDDDRPDLAARSLYESALLDEAYGDPSLAKRELTQLTERFPDASPWNGYAAIAYARLSAISAADVAATLPTVAARFDDVRVAARGKIETGKALALAGRPGDGAALLGEVMGDEAILPALAAEAGVARDAALAFAGRSDARIEALAETIRRFPDVEPWSGVAERMMVDLAEGEGDLAERGRRLSALAEKYSDLGQVAGTALNTMGRRFFEAGRFLQARQSWQETIDRYPDRQRVVDEARFGLAESFVAEEKYADALSVYRTVSAMTQGRAESFRAAREGYIRQGLAKADYERAHGEGALALKTYDQIATFDPTALEAHRGVVQTMVALGEVDQAVARYEEAVRRNPRNPVARYALGLALTYRNPPPLDRAAGLIREGVALDGRSPWMSQTLGWIYEQKGEGDPVWFERALQEYHFALALLSDDASPAQAADLWLNVGNVSYRLGDCGAADEAYGRRDASPHPFANREVEALFWRRWGECGYRLGDDNSAVARFDRGLALEVDDERMTLELLERKGLALQSAGRFDEGAESFEAGLALRRKLFPKESHTPALRNVANSRYLAAGGRPAGSAQRREGMRVALARFLEAETSLADYRPVGAAIAGGGFFNVTVRAGAAAPKVGKGFSVDDEKKLIYHHLARIYEELGRLDLAAVYYEKKLALIPSFLSLVENGPVLTEKGIGANQLGVILARAGRIDEAARWIVTSMDVCRDMANAPCVAVNVDTLARLALEREGAGEWLDRGVALAVEMEPLVAKRFADEKEELARYYLRLGELTQRRLSLALDDDVSRDPVQRGKNLKAAGSDLFEADRWYEKGAELLREVGGVEGPSMRLTALLNRASLAELAGDRKGAHRWRKKVVAEGEATGLDGPVWRALAMMALATPGGAERDELIDRAVERLMGAPFGVVGTDRLTVDLALVRFLFRQRMNFYLALGQHEEALLEMEREALTEAKLSLAPLVAKGDAPDMVRLRDMVEFWRAGVALGATPEGVEERAMVGEEYRALLDEMATRNPFLARIADPRRFDLAAMRKSLRPDESATREVVDPDGETRPLRLGPVDAPKQIVLTGTPFTDPLGERPVEGLVALSPGIAFVDGARRASSPDDYRLFVAGPVAPQQTASLTFGEITAASGPEAETLLTDPALGKGVVWLTLPPKPARSPMGLLFPLSGEGEAESALTLAELVATRRGGAAFITGPVVEPRSETGLVAASILAGYPSWVVDATGDGAMAMSTLATVGETSVGESVAIARMEGKTGRLIGAFGYTAEERRIWAANHFTLRAEAGMDAARRAAWGEAATALTDALRFAHDARIDRFDDPLLSSLAEVLYRQGDWEGSLATQRRVTDLRAEKGDDAGVARSLALTGQVASRLGRHDEAMEALSTAVDLARAAGNMADVADALSQLGLAQENGARYDKALGSFTEAASLARRRGEVGAHAQALTRIGRLALLRTNDFIRAREAYDKAIRLYEQAGDREGALAARLDRGLVEADSGDLRRAESIYKGVMTEARDAGYMALEGEALLRLADVAWYAARYQEARQWGVEAMRFFKEKGNEGKMARAANTLGLVAWSVNDHKAAERWLNRSLTLARQADVPLDEGSALNNLGLVARSLGELATAIDRFTRAGAIDRRLGSRWGEAYTARNLSIAYLMQGRNDDALAEAERAVALTAAIGDRVNGAKAILQKATTLDAMGRTDEAAALYAISVEQSRAVGLPEVEWRGLRGEGRLLAPSDRGAAIALYEQGVAVVEGMRATLKGEEMTGGFLENKQDLYEELILLLLDEERVDEAFAYAERARGRAFVDLLGRGGLRLRDDESQRLADTVTTLRRQIALSARTGERDERLEAELDRTLATIRRDHPDLLPLVAVPRFDAEPVLARLGDDVALIEYLSTPKELVIFLLADGRVLSRRVPVGREELSRAVADLRQRIETGAPVGDLPSRLGGWLVDPVINDLADHPLWGIAPHGPLHYLPFAALESAGAPLLERATLFLTPTASAMRMGKGGDLLVSGLAMGNPDLGDDRFALPMAGLEAESVGWSLRDAEVVTGVEATETLFRRQAPGYRTIHVASHGAYDPAAPLSSALMLAPDGANDGRLTTAEVFSLPLAADLVTLSACQTGVGDVSRGEEVTGLTRAFLYAGAKGVVSTLWRVDDLASALLVKHFYRNLAAMPKAEALREAQRTVRKRFPHPAYWGAFVLTGDPL